MRLIFLFIGIVTTGNLMSETELHIAELKDSELPEMDVPKASEPVKISGVLASFVVIEDLDGSHFFALKLKNTATQEVEIPLSEIYRHSNIEVIASGRVLLTALRETPIDLAVPPKVRLKPGSEKYMRIDFREYSYFNELLKGKHKTFWIRHLAFNGERQKFSLGEK